MDRPTTTESLSPQLLEPLPDSLSFSDGEAFTLSCRISNVKPSHVKWEKNGRMARMGSRFKVG